MPTDCARVRFLDIQFDALTQEELLKQLDVSEADQPFRYLVTPNVDHMVRLEAAEDERVRGAYAESAWCVCDSRILARIAALCGVMLPVVPGSDLTAALFERILRVGDQVSVVGGDEAMVAGLRTLRPDVGFVHHEPPMGLIDKPDAMARAAEFIVTSNARFHLLAIGSPQQELLARQVVSLEAARGTALCIGAALHFITGVKQRAPLYLQRAGLEWAFRLASEPRRMWRRYLVDGPKIFFIARRWARSRPRKVHP